MKTVLLFVGFALLSPNTEPVYTASDFIGTYTLQYLLKLPKAEPTEKKAPLTLTREEVAKLPYFRPFQEIKFDHKGNFKTYHSPIMNSPFSELILKKGKYKVEGDQLILHFKKIEYWELPRSDHPAKPNEIQTVIRNKRKTKRIDEYKNLQIIRTDSLILNDYSCLIKIPA